MGKRSRMLRSSSLGGGSPLDKIFCRDPADAWVVTSPPTPPPANPTVTDRPSPPPSPSPSLHVETDLEVVEALPPMSKMRIASPRDPIPSEPRKEAPEGSLTSPGIFSVDASCLEPSAEDFAPKKTGELLESCPLCKKVLEANEPVYMFGTLKNLLWRYMRAFCSSFCQAKQMKLEGVLLATNTEGSEVSPTYVDKKSGSTRSQLDG